MAFKDPCKPLRGESKAFSKSSFMMLTVSVPVYLCFVPFFCSGNPDVAGLNKEMVLKSSNESTVEVTQLEENKLSV